MVRFSIRLFCSADKYKALIGVWSGSVEHTISIPVLAHFLLVNDNLVGYLDVPIQRVKKLPIDTITKTSDLVSFDIKKIRANFSGLMNDNTAIHGSWKQNGYNLSLRLKKINDISDYALPEPQLPTKNKSYLENEIEFENEKADIKLSGTFICPKNKKPLAAVVLAHGSGGQDRDQTIFNHKPFLVIAEHLTSQGIAVLRFDERGIGKSGGSFSTASDLDFADDVSCGINYLKNREETKDVKIGVLGHSKGGLTSMIVAQKHKIEFMVLLGVPGVNGAKCIQSQIKLIGQIENVPSKSIEYQLKVVEYICELLKEESNSSILIAKSVDYMDNLISNSNQEDQEQLENTKKAVISQLTSYNTPWFRNFLIFEPQLNLSKITIPILGLWGSMDLQVPVKENLSAVKSALEKSKHKNFKLIELEGLNHLFQNCKTGSPSEYIQIEETFSPKALNIISDWILEITSNNKKISK